MNELKPCPFCGYSFDDIDKRDMELYATSYINPDVSTIGCDACGALGPEQDTREKATEKWNTRYHNYDMPAIVRQNELLKDQLGSLEVAFIQQKEELNRLQDLVYGDGERDTDHVIS